MVGKVVNVGDRVIQNGSIPGPVDQAIGFFTGAVLGPLARPSASASAEKSVASGLWQLNPFERGRRIEEMLGQNLVQNFPVIDKFKGGIAASINGLDLDSVSYQNNARLSRTFIVCIDKFADFNGHTWGGREIFAHEISGRGLALAVPHSGSLAQQDILAQSVNYGSVGGVGVGIVTVP